jgi:hypothetical protein
VLVLTAVALVGVAWQQVQQSRRAGRLRRRAERLAAVPRQRSAGTADRDKHTSR